MFRFTQKPSSGSQSQCLAKNYRYGSTVLVHMNVFSIMAAYTAGICRHNTDSVHVDQHSGKARIFNFS